MSYAVGVDIGGSKVAAGVVDDHGTVVEKVRLPSPKTDPVALREAVQTLVGELRSRHEVTAVGVGAAGFVSADRRRVLFAPHLRFGDEPIADVIEQNVGLPVAIENDGNAAAWAEHAFGAGRGEPDQLMVAIGTGIGGEIGRAWC